MRILITGDRGFVGSHICTALEADGHEIVGLEATPTFREWYDEMYEVMEQDIDAVIHIGAISNNQSKDPDIYLWNSYATFLLAQRVRQKMHSMSPIPFIFFSSFLVGSTMADWSTRTPYSWSKAQAENFVRVYLPHATILRPAVMWGNEQNKQAHQGSVPWRLAAHNLEYLLRNWNRKYVHIADVIAAVKLCLENRPKGTFDLAPDYFWSNEELAKLVEWKGYEWADNPLNVGFNYISSHESRDELPTPPGWAPKVLMEEELPRLERELNR